MQPLIAGGRAFERFAELRRNEVRQIGRRRCRDFLARLLFALVGREAVLAVPDRVRLDVAAGRHERFRLPPLAADDLLHRPAGRDRRHVLVQDGCALLFDGMLVVVLDQQPVCPFAAIAIVAHPDEHEATMQALAMKHELEVTLLQGLFRRLIAFGFPIATIPEHDRTTAILPLRDCAFEVAIVERVILDFDG